MDVVGKETLKLVSTVQPFKDSKYKLSFFVDYCIPALACLSHFSQDNSSRGGASQR